MVDLILLLRQGLAKEGHSGITLLEQEDLEENTWEEQLKANKAKMAEMMSAFARLASNPSK